MYPPASGVAKRAHKGMKLAGYSIPEGTRLLVCVLLSLDRCMTIE